MKKINFFIIFFWITIKALSQMPAKPLQQINTTAEQEMENLASANEEEEIDDDTYLQQLLQYQNHPIDINGDENALKELRFITPVQLQNLVVYRKHLGELINIYELQSVPGWDVTTIQKARPYITVQKDNSSIPSLLKRLRQGDHILLIRSSRILEKAKGYIIDPDARKNFYKGSPQKLLVRYKYNYKNLLQYGLLGEKDAGEQFFKGKQKIGFDFCSAHFFMRKTGMIRSLALGDFTVNMGQGLIQWMSLAFKKGTDVLSVKRESEVLRPYSAAGEINFYRGAGITVNKNRWEATVFGSLRNIDANFLSSDTSISDDDIVTSLQTSGYHRTASENADKSIQRQITFGGNVSYRNDDFRVGFNSVQQHFKYPLKKRDEPYNFYAASGKSFVGYSVDYSFTHQNFHAFGEVASTEKKSLGIISGLMISTSVKTDLSIVYRNISPSFHSFYGNAFTESSSPSNEKGLFTGIAFRPTSVIRIDGYIDLYSFPWVRYRVDKPSSGKDYTLQLTYKPNKLLEIYCRYRNEIKPGNNKTEEFVLAQVKQQAKKSFRMNLTCKLNPIFTFRTRCEILQFDNQLSTPQNGFLLYSDLLYDPSIKKISGGFRLQYFETDSYESRLYAFENDVLYSSSIPVFYGKGYRYSLIINCKLLKSLSFQAKIAGSVFPHNRSIGSGLDEIPKSHKTEVKLQMVCQF